MPEKERREEVQEVASKLVRNSTLRAWGCGGRRCLMPKNQTVNGTCSEEVKI